MTNQPTFRSLRLRLLAPMIATALIAAGVVAFASYRLGTSWAVADLESRFEGIRTTLADSRFPLNATVLDSLADLTRTELVGLTVSGRMSHSTVELPGSTTERLRPAERETPAPWQLALATDQGHRNFQVYSFETDQGPDRADRVAVVYVLFDEQQFDATRRRAALLPLVTGLSTILAITSIMLIISSRLVRRIGRLQQRVETVAAGNFESNVSDRVGDEIGMLGESVDVMAAQLDKLWNQVNRQQSEKLLHQIAGGMAHQLRNSLTGARMAVELHAADCAASDDEGIEVAIDQLELSEDHVRRLLLAASGQQDRDRPVRLDQCFDDVRRSLAPIAKHLRVDLQWELDPAAAPHILKDGPSWVAAVNNLIHNAIQAGDRVDVDVAAPIDSVVRTTVTDNGTGIEDSIAEDVFEPFVTSKSEGMGLGLSVVQRSAEHLGGTVRWRRVGRQTLFELDVPTESAS